MMTVTIERSDQRFMTRWRWESVATQWAMETGEILNRAIQARAPVSKKPSGGTLRDSITFKPMVSATSARVEFTSRVPYANYVIHGTPAHTIMVKNARALRWQQGGHWAYSQRVHHPGAKANPFPEKAVLPLIPLVRSRMKNLLVKNLGGA